MEVVYTRLCSGQGANDSVQSIEREAWPISHRIFLWLNLCKSSAGLSLNQGKVETSVNLGSLNETTRISLCRNLKICEADRTSKHRQPKILAGRDTSGLKKNLVSHQLQHTLYAHSPAVQTAEKMKNDRKRNSISETLRLDRPE